MKTILLPGGLGYIGSHTLVELLSVSDVKTIIIDDYSNCQEDILERIYSILPSDKVSHIHVRTGNILDAKFLQEVFLEQQEIGTPIEGVIHFAAKKNAPESVQFPMLYYENNVIGSMNLLKMVQKFKECKYFLFSSTAAVYGDQDNCSEDFQCKPISPYGQSKYSFEMILKGVARAHPEKNFISLRYFNPAGCHSSGKIGDWPSNYPGNLFPVIQEYILGRRKELKVYGLDYNTPDKSGVRDYIHVVDLAQGHIKALQKLLSMNEQYNYDVFNLGSGTGYSVLEVISTFQKVLGKNIQYIEAPRRSGDMGRLVAVVEKAKKDLNWCTRKNLEDMCRSCVNFVYTTLQKTTVITPDDCQKQFIKPDLLQNSNIYRSLSLRH